MCPTWVLTVVSERWSRPAISAFEAPRAISTSTSRSRPATTSRRNSQDSAQSAATRAFRFGVGIRLRW
jgi:hypothetical protein